MKIDQQKGRKLRDKTIRIQLYHYLLWLISFTSVSDTINLMY